MPTRRTALSEEPAIVDLLSNTEQAAFAAVLKLMADVYTVDGLGPALGTCAVIYEHTKKTLEELLMDALSKEEPRDPRELATRAAYSAIALCEDMHSGLVGRQGQGKGWKSLLTKKKMTSVH